MRGACGGTKIRISDHCDFMLAEKGVDNSGVLVTRQQLDRLFQKQNSAMPKKTRPITPLSAA
jgi:hypothetical protein